MQVILREDVRDLGRIGEVVTVKPGYARNYLIPKNLAVEATRRNLGQREHNQRLLSKQADKRRAEEATLVERLEGLSVTVAKAAGEGDKLYGSVTTRDVIQALADENIRGIDRKQVQLDDPIRQLGIYDVVVKLSGEKSATLKLWVVTQ